MKAFISYAHADDAWRADFHKWMSQLRHDGLFSVWTDHALVPGVVWDEKIRQELAAADVVIFLLTQNFVRSDYINHVEVRLAVEGARRDDKLLIPVRCEPSTADYGPLGVYQPVPAFQLQPISQWTDCQSAWLHVFHAIKVASEQHRDRYDLPALNRAMLADRRLANLPALFPGAPERLLASLYVELRVAPRRLVSRHPRLLAAPQSLAERLTEHERYLRAANLSIAQAIHEESARRFVLVGDPGSGKSSLLRQIALKVVAGQWSRWQCGFFVELRRLVRRKRPEDAWTRELLLSLAIEPWLEPQEQARRLARQWARGLDGPGRPLLLFDGLDEIVGDDDAHAEICELIARLPPSVDWIVTSRATGLTRPLAEDRRYEVAPLDDMGVAGLVANWFCTSQPAPIRDVSDADQRGDALVKEILAKPRLLSMARNPFLLSALCFLREIAPVGHVLPSTRTGVYDELLHQVARHAQTHYGDRRILDTEAQRALARFCLWTYEQTSETPFQIFEMGHWQIFQDEEGVSVDFHARILPGRLITQVSEIGEAFHFLHLSLHEFLIARAALDEPVEDMLRRRYLPTWRPVLMFYGALLLRAGRNEDFRRVVAALAEPPDLTHLMLIETAQLLDEADVLDTRPVLGYDLTDRLWQAWLSQEQFTSRAALEALWRAPWSEIETRVGELIAAREAEIRALPPGDDPDRSPPQLSGPDPYMLLAGRRDGVSERRLLTRFLDEPDHRIALCMVKALAAALTRSGRDEVAENARRAWGSPAQERFLALLETTKHPDFLPLVAGLIAETGTETVDYRRLANALAATESESAVEILEREAMRCLRSPKSPIRTSALVDFVGALASKATAARAGALCRIQAEARNVDDFIVELAELQLARILPFNESAMLESILLTEEELQLEELLHAVSDTQARGASVSAAFVRAVARHVDALAEDWELPQVIWRELLAIDRNRIESSGAPALLDRALPSLNELVAMDHEPLDPGNTDYELGQVRVPGVPLDDVGLSADDARQMFHALASYLATARCLPALDALLKVAGGSPEQWGRASRYTALEEIAELADATTEVDQGLCELTVGTLTRIFRDANASGDREIAEAAAWAIGCWDLAALMGLRSEPNVNVPLCRFSSEKGYLIYESFFVAPNGETTDLPVTRDRIFVVMPVVVADEFVETFFSHLVTWGFTNDVVDPASCLGGIVIAPQPVTEADLHQDLLRLLTSHASAAPQWPVLILSTDADHAHGLMERLALNAQTVCVSPVARTAAEYASLRSAVEAWQPA